ncbi:hypothetical protein J2129_001454 [Methanofollis sp. W23]|nr:hypothetical protein [Methanofollis sp. W23]
MIGNLRVVIHSAKRTVTMISTERFCRIWHEPPAHAYVMNMIIGLQSVWIRAPLLEQDPPWDHHFVAVPGAR